MHTVGFSIRVRSVFKGGDVPEMVSIVIKENCYYLSLYLLNSVQLGVKGTQANSLVLLRFMIVRVF